MANEDLVNYRQDLSEDFSSLWDELDSVIQNMKRDFSQDDRDNFKECTGENPPMGDNVTECLEMVAAEMGVADSFRRKLNNADGLVSNLRSQGRAAAESNSVSEAVRGAADFAQVSELNRLCAQGRYDDVEDEIPDDALAAVQGSVDSYTDCVSATSEAADLRNSLKTAYGTN